MPQRGFAPILIVLLIGIALVVAGGAYYFGLDHGFEKSVSQTPQITSPTPIVSESTSSADTANWKTYTNNQYKYYIKYPSNWLTANSDGDFYNDEYFSDPGIDKNLHQRITIRVIKYVGPKWKNSKEYFDEIYQNSTKLTILGLPAAKEIVNGGKPNSETYYSTNIYIYMDNLVYVLSNSSTEKATVDKYEPIFDQILSTFKFTQ